MHYLGEIDIRQFLQTLNYYFVNYLLYPYLLCIILEKRWGYLQMKNEIVTNVINGMMEILNSEQIQKLKMQIYIAMNDYEVIKKKNELAPVYLSN